MGNILFIGLIVLGAALVVVTVALILTDRKDRKKE